MTLRELMREEAIVGLKQEYANDDLTLEEFEVEIEWVLGMRDDFENGTGEALIANYAQTTRNLGDGMQVS
jgi:hypothetical protein